MKEDIQRFKDALQLLYGNDPGILDKQLKRYSNLADLFRTKFGDLEMQFFSTPGRTEIGGNHTDHNHGRVLAGSINLDSVAIASGNESATVRIHSAGYNDPFEVTLDDLEAKEEEYGTTTSLIRGIAARLKELGYKIEGFNACITSDVLPGSGLSSSASIEVLIGNMFSALFNENQIKPEILAMTGQYAENNFFGKPCGLMDQVACAMGGIVTIDFEDPGQAKIEKVEFDFDAQDYALLVVDTGGTHADLTDDYAAVPAEMKSVALALGGNVCRDISKKDFMAGLKHLRADTGDRAVLRAMHFLGDNQRVADQVQALANGDFQSFLQLVSESGSSSYKRLQNIYTSKSTREQGVALALALTEDYLRDINAGACRVHGGGFAGTIQEFLQNQAVAGFRDLLEPVYGEGSVHVLKIRQPGTVHLNSFPQ